MTDKEKARVQITIQGHDCDDIPKVADAGMVVTPLDGKPYQIMHNGIKLYNHSHYGEFYTRIISGLRGYHEPQQEKVFYEVLKQIKPGGTMIELGSYWAYYSLWFNQQIEGAVNYMVEPMARHLQDGRDNFALNKRSGHFTQACVGREALPEVAFKHNDETKHQSRQISVDTFMESHALAYVDILHADVEAAEYEMLLGSQQAITTGRIGYLFISTHGDLNHENCLRFLLKKKCFIIAECNHADSYSVDGLIVAATKAIANPVRIPISYRRPRWRRWYMPIRDWYISSARLPTALRTIYRKYYWKLAQNT